MKIRIWSKGTTHSSGKDEEQTYHVELEEVDLFEYLKARLFCAIFCERLFGSWHGWTDLGNKRWAPDPFRLKGFEHKHGKWHRDRRVPLYTWSDLHCKLNTGRLHAVTPSVTLSISQEEYEKLAEGSDDRLSFRRKRQEGVNS